MTLTKKTNPKSTEYWQGYRDMQSEILMAGIEAVEAKYAIEFEDNNNIHFRGMKKALTEYKRRLAEMLKR